VHLGAAKRLVVHPAQPLQQLHKVLNCTPDQARSSSVISQKLGHHNCNGPRLIGSKPSMAQSHQQGHLDLMKEFGPTNRPCEGRFWRGLFFGSEQKSAKCLQRRPRAAAYLGSGHPHHLHPSRFDASIALLVNVSTLFVLLAIDLNQDWLQRTVWMSQKEVTAFAALRVDVRTQRRQCNLCDH
jgi:hypothetical protein